LHGTTSFSKVTQDQIKSMNESTKGKGGSNTFHVKRARQSKGCKPRDYYRVRRGNGPQWDMPNNDIDSVSHAILERVFFTKHQGGFRLTPKPHDECNYPGMELGVRKERARDHVKLQTDTFMSEMKEMITRDGKASPMTTGEFLDCYGGAKRRVYEHAVKSLDERKFSSTDCRVKTFTKDEYRKPGGAPRAIQPRSPRFNVMMGRYIKHLEHKLFGYIDRIFDPLEERKTVAKGMSMATRGATIASMWNSFNDPVAIGLDASRFDQHINVLLIELEHTIYRAASTGVGDEMPTLDRLLKAQKRNVGRYYGSDGSTIKYEVEGNRMSGDMNTSLGNVIIMCCLMYSYLKYKGLEHRAKMLNDGDDCVLIMERGDVKKFRKGMENWFTRMGITMCYDGTYNSLEEIEFCQSRPVLIKGGYTLVPRATKRLYSDLITTKFLGSKKVYRRWMGAVAGCGLASCDGVPVFGEFYKWIARSSKPWLPQVGDYYYRYRDMLCDDMVYEDTPVSWASRISYYHAFDITPGEQLILEKYYRNLQMLHWSRPIEGETSWSFDVQQTLAMAEQKMQ